VLLWEWALLPRPGALLCVTVLLGRALLSLLLSKLVSLTLCLPLLLLLPLLLEEVLPLLFPLLPLLVLGLLPWPPLRSLWLVPRLPS